MPLPRRCSRDAAAISLVNSNSKVGTMLKDNPRFARMVGGVPERLGLWMLSHLQYFQLGAHKQPSDVRLIKQVRRERTCLMSAFECFTLHSLAKACGRMPGEIAEVGCYRGASTKLICEAVGGVHSNKTVHVFDTFEGLPKSSPPDRGIHDENQYACSLESVREYLQPYSNVRYYKGIFPATSEPVNDLQFSFVNCDVDLYEGTLGCLEFFYPRLVPGGILMSHDYSMLNGVKQAFTEFLADKPESAVELPTSQCMLVKRG